MTERTELPDEVKAFVVQALACFDTPSEVAKAVKEEFGLVVSRQGGPIQHGLTVRFVRSGDAKPVE